MFTSIADKITTQLEMNDAIKSEDRAIYQYGIQQGLSIMFNLITTFMLGVFTGMIGESIAFTIAYMLLRPYAGGFHAKTPIRCYIYSVIMVITVLLAIKLLPLASVVYVYFLVAGSLIIALFAPVEDKRKPLDETEQHVYRKRSLLLLVAEMLTFVICFIFRAKLFYSSIAMAILSIAVLVMAGVLKNTFCSKSA